MILDSTSTVCLSGGAAGADLQWGMCAGIAGHQVVHWSFPGHRTLAPPEEIVLLSPDLLAQADPHCLRANQTLRRHFPPRSAYARDLIRRDWYQVAEAGSCYAVSALIDGRVAGGTAWAVQMFIDRHDGAACPAYLFHEPDCRWHEWTGRWTPIYTAPPPQGIWAGIGSTKMTSVGKLAIRVLLNYTQLRGRRRGGAAQR